MLRQAARRTVRPGVSRKEEQAVDTSLKPVRPSKVSKARTIKNADRRQNQPRASAVALSHEPLLSTGQDIAQPICQVVAAHPRRSKRLQLLEYSMAEDSNFIASAASLEVNLQTRPKRNITSNQKSAQLVNP